MTSAIQPYIPTQALQTALRRITYEYVIDKIKKSKPGVVVYLNMIEMFAIRSLRAAMRFKAGSSSAAGGEKYARCYDYLNIPGIQKFVFHRKFKGLTKSLPTTKRDWLDGGEFEEKEKKFGNITIKPLEINGTPDPESVAEFDALEAHTRDQISILNELFKTNPYVHNGQVCPPIPNTVGTQLSLLYHITPSEFESDESTNTRYPGYCTITKVGSGKAAKINKEYNYDAIPKDNRKITIMIELTGAAAANRDKPATPCKVAIRRMDYSDPRDNTKRLIQKETAWSELNEVIPYGSMIIPIGNAAFMWDDSKHKWTQKLYPQEISVKKLESGRPPSPDTGEQLAMEDFASANIDMTPITRTIEPMLPAASSSAPSVSAPLSITSVAKMTKRLPKSSKPTAVHKPTAVTATSSTASRRTTTNNRHTLNSPPPSPVLDENEDEVEMTPEDIADNYVASDPE